MHLMNVYNILLVHFEFASRDKILKNPAQIPKKADPKPSQTKKYEKPNQTQL